MSHPRAHPAHHAASLHALMAGQQGEIAFGIALLALAVIAISRKRQESDVTLTEVAVVAAFAFAMFWPGFHHAKIGPRLIAFVIMAAVILVARSVLRVMAKGKEQEKPQARASAYYPPAPRATTRQRGH